MCTSSGRADYKGGEGGTVINDSSGYDRFVNGSCSAEGLRLLSPGVQRVSQDVQAADDGGGVAPWETAQRPRG